MNHNCPEGWVLYRCWAFDSNKLEVWECATCNEEQYKINGKIITFKDFKKWLKEAVDSGKV